MSATPAPPSGVRLAVDAMGGDHGPAEIVPGTLDHARAHPEDHVLLVGDPARIRASAGGELPSNVEVVPASQVIQMHEHPALALREVVKTASAFYLLGYASAKNPAATKNTGIRNRWMKNTIRLNAPLVCGSLYGQAATNGPAM